MPRGAVAQPAPQPGGTAPTVTDEANATTAGPPLSESPTSFDREVIERIVRDELRAEKARAAAAEQAPKAGSDRRMYGRWDNGYVVESADKCFRFHAGGRMEFDNCWFAQDDNLLMGTTPTQTLRDGTLMRRARFRTDGRMWGFADFVCEVNFANIQDVGNVDNGVVQVGSVGITDFHVTFRDVPCFGNVRIGHLQAPISLERYTGSNVWYYMERSTMWDAFYNPNDYQSGVAVFDSWLDDRVTLGAAAGWVGRADVQSFAFGANEGTYGAGIRGTALPAYEDEGRILVHLGAGFFHQALVDNRFNIASRPLLRAGAGGGDTPNLLFTGALFTPNGVSITNAEAAFVAGPFSVSSEYAIATIDDAFDQGAPFAGPRGDLAFHGGYVEGGLFVTPGDRRRYDKATGTWGRTVPVNNACHLVQRGLPGNWYGAVQLVARYTYLDLVSGAPVITPTTGGARAGSQHDMTLGLNWHLNPQLFFMLNYAVTHIESVVPGASGDLQGIGCRLHLDF